MSASPQLEGQQQRWAAVHEKVEYIHGATQFAGEQHLQLLPQMGFGQHWRQPDQEGDEDGRAHGHTIQPDQHDDAGCIRYQQR